MKNIKFIALFILLFQLYSPLCAQRKYDYNYIPYRKGDKWGYCDSLKKVLIKPAYDHVEETFYIVNDSDPKRKFAVVKNNGKRGVIDRTGTLIIPCEYDDAFSFSNPNAITFQNEKSKFSYDLTKKEITKLYDFGKSEPLREVRIAIGYYKPEKISPGLFKIVHHKPGERNNDYMYERVDSIIVKADTVVFWYSTDSTFKIKYKDKWGIASFGRNVLLPANYDTVINVWQNGLYALKEGNSWLIYQRKDSIEKLTVAGEGFFKIVNGASINFLTKRNRKFGILDDNANTKIPFIYDSILLHPSNVPTMAAKIRKTWRFYDVALNEPIDSNFFDDIRFDEIWSRHFIVKKKKTWYIRTSQPNTEYIYPHTKPYKEYFVDYFRNRVTIYDKGRILIGYANFQGLNYWDD